MNRVYMECVPLRSKIGDVIVMRDSYEQHMFIRISHGSRRVWINISTGERINSRAMRAKFAPPPDPLAGLSLEERARIRADRDEFFSNGKEPDLRRPCTVCGKTGNTREMCMSLARMTFTHVDCGLNVVKR